MPFCPQARFLLVLFALLATGACGSASRRAGGAAEGQAQTTVRVENRNFLDMNVYVVRSGQRMRLGTVPGTSTRVFPIPAHLLFGGTQLQFLADPIGSRQTPISDTIVVNPGDEVMLILPS